MASRHKHDRDDKRERWAEQAHDWHQQRDAPDDELPEPEEPEPVNTLH